MCPLEAGLRPASRPVTLLIGLCGGPPLLIIPMPQELAKERVIELVSTSPRSNEESFVGQAREIDVRNNLGQTSARTTRSRSLMSIDIAKTGRPLTLYDGQPRLCVCTLGGPDGQSENSSGKSETLTRLRSKQSN